MPTRLIQSIQLQWEMKKVKLLSDVICRTTSMPLTLATRKRAPHQGCLQKAVGRHSMLHLTELERLAWLNCAIER